MKTHVQTEWASFSEHIGHDDVFRAQVWKTEFNIIAWLFPNHELEVGLRIWPSVSPTPVPDFAIRVNVWNYGQRPLVQDVSKRVWSLIHSPDQRSERGRTRRLIGVCSCDEAGPMGTSAYHTSADRPTFSGVSQNIAIRIGGFEKGLGDPDVPEKHMHGQQTVP